MATRLLFCTGCGNGGHQRQTTHDAPHLAQICYCPYSTGHGTDPGFPQPHSRKDALLKVLIAGAGIAANGQAGEKT